MRRKFRKEKLAAFCLICLLAAMMTGCGSPGYKSDSIMTASYDTGRETMYSAEAAAYEESVLSDNSTSLDVSAAMQDRKLIKTVEMSVETKEYDKMTDGLMEQITACGGYVENMDSYNGSIYSDWRSSRSASVTIRIPQDHLDEFLSQVTQISNVVRRSDSVEDITLTYVDVASRKAALVTEQERLLELLKMAETVEDIIAIEERLSNVRYQIESIESQLRTYDNQVSYSTVYLNIEEVRELTPVKEETVWERITGGFMDSVHGVLDAVKEFLIWLIVNSPYLVIWAAVITGVFLLLRRFRRKRKLSRQKEGKPPARKGQELTKEQSIPQNAAESEKEEKKHE